MGGTQGEREHAPSTRPETRTRFICDFRNVHRQNVVVQRVVPNDVGLRSSLQVSKSFRASFQFASFETKLQVPRPLQSWGKYAKKKIVDFRVCRQGNVEKKRFFFLLRLTTTAAGV